MGNWRISRRCLLAAPLGLALAPGVFAQRTRERPLSTDDNPPEDGAPSLFEAWIDAHGRPTAAVSINGVGPYRFLVDTGATTTVVSARHAPAMGLQPLGLLQVNGTTGTAELPMASVGLLSTGSVRRQNLRVALIDEAMFSRWDGILGADVFVGHRLTFDIERKMVRLEYPPPGQIFGRRQGPNVRLRNGVLAEIRGRVGSLSTRLVLDTGADGSIINPVLAKALNLRYRALARTPDVMVTGVTGVALVGEAVVLPRVEIAGITATDCVAVAADASIFGVWGLQNDSAMLVGMDLLSRLSSFTIDYRARRFEATPMAQLMSGDPASLG